MSDQAATPSALVLPLRLAADLRHHHLPLGAVQLATHRVGLPVLGRPPTSPLPALLLAALLGVDTGRQEPDERYSARSHTLTLYTVSQIALIRNLNDAP